MTPHSIPLALGISFALLGLAMLCGELLSKSTALEPGEIEDAQTNINCAVILIAGGVVLALVGWLV